jgi:hypothetical protein
MAGGGQQLGGEGQMNYMVNGPGAGGAFTSTPQNPQWLKGMQLGTQLAQQGMGLANQVQRPPIQPTAPARPMGMVGSAPMGMPQQSVVPGAVPQQPPAMASGGMGLNNGQQGGINPQLLQMLMRSR